MFHVLLHWLHMLNFWPFQNVCIVRCTILGLALFSQTWKYSKFFFCYHDREPDMLFSTVQLHVPLHVNGATRRVLDLLPSPISQKNCLVPWRDKSFFKISFLKRPSYAALSHGDEGKHTRYLINLFGKIDHLFVYLFFVLCYLLQVCKFLRLLCTFFMS